MAHTRDPPHKVFERSKVVILQRGTCTFLIILAPTLIQTLAADYSSSWALLRCQHHAAWWSIFGFFLFTVTHGLNAVGNIKLLTCVLLWWWFFFLVKDFICSNNKLTYINILTHGWTKNKVADPALKCTLWAVYWMRWGGRFLGPAIFLGRWHLPSFVQRELELNRISTTASSSS